jgi:hypothetical protein
MDVLLVCLGKNAKETSLGWALMGHVPVQKITDDFVLALCSKLTRHGSIWQPSHQQTIKTSL